MLVPLVLSQFLPNLSSQSGMVYLIGQGCSDGTLGPDSKDFGHDCGEKEEVFVSVIAPWWYLIALMIYGSRI